MDFMKEYEKWLSSPALSKAERSELEAIKDDPKEIESRFYGPFGRMSCASFGGRSPRPPSPPGSTS